MMIFNSFTVSTIIILARNDLTGGRRIFFPTNKTFKGILLALPGNFFKKSWEFFLYLKPFRKKILI